MKSLCTFTSKIVSSWDAHQPLEYSIVAYEDFKMTSYSYVYHVNWSILRSNGRVIILKFQFEYILLMIIDERFFSF